MRALTPTLVLALLGAGLGASPAAAQPFGVRLSLDRDPRTTVAIAWNSTSAGDDRVVIGTGAGLLDRTVMADETFTMPAPLGTAFVAHVDTLDPGTRYHYRIANAGGPVHPPAATAPFSFRTFDMDPCAAFTVVVIGDNRADTDGTGPSPLWSDILAEALAFEPDVMVNTGDMVKNGNQPGEWINFLNDSEPGFANVPSIVTMGNHDEDDVNGDGAIFNRLFALPRNSRTDTEDYYSIDLGPIHFVSLNTQFTRPGTTELMQMVEWLRGDLTASSQPWTVVYFHKAVYSRGNHSSGEENGGAINSSFVPIFDELDVDLVLNGHSHDYERYAPSVGVDREFGGAGRSFPAGDGSAIRARADALPDGMMGTHYVVTGGAGALTTDVFGFTCMDAACTRCLPFGNSCPDEVYDNDVTGTVIYDGRHNFVVLSVMGDQISAEVRATMAGNSRGAGEQIDSFSIANGSFPMELCTGGPMPGTDGGVPGTDGGPGVDSGTPGPGVDSGTPARDGGGIPGRDSGGVVRRDGGGGGGPGAGDDGGCGCVLAGGMRRAPWLDLFGLALAAGLLRRGRRRTS